MKTEGSDISAKDKVLFLAHVAIDKKATAPVILEIGQINPFADFFLILNGRSDRHVQAISEAIHKALKDLKEEILGMEGYEEGRWVLIDCGEVIVHVFQETIREYYDLEGLWIDAPRLNLNRNEEEKPGGKTLQITRNDLDQFKKRLLEERMVIIKEMDKFIEDANTFGKDGTMDIGDEASELSSRQLLLSLSESERKKLLEIDRALERIVEGTYGRCAECGEPISHKRLEVKPSALYCVACKTHRETLEKKELNQ